MRSLRDAGADGVVVVADHPSASQLRHALGLEDEKLADVDWVELDAPVGLVAGIRAAGGVLAGERFLLHRPDGLLMHNRATLRRALADRDSNATLFFRTRRAADPVALHSVGAASRLGVEPEGDVVMLDGIYAFAPALFDALRELEPGSEGTGALLEAIEWLDQSPAGVRAELLDGWWQYSNHPQYLLDANRQILDALEPVALEGRWPESRFEGRVHADPTAQIRGALIRGPVIIGAGAKVVDAYVGPYTAIGREVVVQNAEVESSMLLAGSSVCHVGARIEASILGRGAAVTRDFRLPRGMRLLMGEGARLTLS
ncbi:MAG: hypothetical protein H0V22_02005 [Solirubrobacterales bacterium]|nr:hypothetical protein [Solirubrobacterales bacterium]